MTFHTDTEGLSFNQTNRGAVKDARKASKKEKILKRVIGGLSGFLAVFATIFLILWGVGLSKSINEAAIPLAIFYHTRPYIHTGTSETRRVGQNAF